METTLFVIVIVILTFCGFTDAIFRSTWRRFYYTKGITFFNQVYDYPYPFNTKRVDLLIKRENADKKYKSDIVFNVMARNAIAFFDKPGKGSFATKKRSYFSVMHGIMLYGDGKLTVAGVFDYFALLFIPALLISLTAYIIRLYKEGYYINSLILVAMGALFVGGFAYALKKQKRRFIEVGNIMVGIGKKEKEKEKASDAQS